MPVTEAPLSVALGADAVPGVLALVAEAGWNQTAADLALMLGHGRMIGMKADGGRLIASAVALPMGPSIGWVSMVLVTATWRRRGIATRLVGECVAWLEAGGRAACLDATAMGRQVYSRMGFAEMATLTRWARPAGGGAAGRPRSVQPEGSMYWPALAEYDAEIFGAAREFVLGDMMRRCGGLFLPASGGNGFLLARAGRLATQIGPVSAEDEAAAAGLLAGGLAVVSEPVVIDAFEAQPGFARLLAANGFVIERRFHRMMRGRTGRLGDPRRAFAAAGPELG